MTDTPTLFFVNRYFHPDLSATSQLLGDLVFDLARGGYRVEVITGRQDYGDPSRVLAPFETIGGAAVRRVATTRFGRANLAGRAVDYLTFYLAAGASLIRRLRAGDLVVAETDPPLISVVAALAARIRGAALVNWIQDLFPEVATALGVRAVAPLAPLLRALRNRSLRIAKRNVVLGDRMAARLRALGIPGETIAVIPNWADEGALAPVPREANPLRAQWGLDGAFVIGYSGNMGRAHEFETIIGAAEILKHEPAIRFLFIGAGAGLAYLEREAARRGLANVAFKPYQPREALSRSLSAADVHLISLKPALEGLIVPSKFYGVAAVGRPTLYIGDPGGEIPAILARAQCGFTVAPGDAAGLAGRIRDLAADSHAAAALGARARMLAETEFAKARALEEWRKVIDATL
jgi:glycosyltransferase involved in cell wall biosynthesis